MTEQEKMLNDVIVTAVEGGTGYWAAALKYDPGYGESALSYDTPASVFLCEEDGDVVALLNPQTVKLAMLAIRDRQEINVADRFRSECAVALATNDAGECDSDTADVIAQVVAFGEVVYG